MSKEKEFKLLDYPIFAKGHGTVSKYILCDPGLSISAKGVYCYLRSLCGRNSDSSFPGIFQTMKFLGISKTTYYKARDELLNAGIIVIHRNKNEGQFDNNTYSFPLQPSRYMVTSDDAYIQSVCEDIQEYGIMAKYGLCPYLVMSDNDLSMEAKVMFSYISAFINITEKPYAELSPNWIQYHLGISHNTYQKYLRELCGKEYIFVNRLRENGSFKQTSRYAINYMRDPAKGITLPDDTILFDPTPKPKKEETVEPPETKKWEMVESPETKKWETVESPETKKWETVESPETKKWETVESPETKKWEMIKGETKKQETTITSITSTSSKQIIYDGLINTVRKKIDYWLFELAGEGTPQILEAATLLVDAIVDILNSQNPVTIINGEPLTTAHVRKVLMQVNNSAAMNVLNRCLAKMDDITNMKSYLLTSIYNEIQAPTKEVEDYEAY